MKTSTRILIISILLGVLFWVVDAGVDHVFFNMHRFEVISSQTYWLHEFYMRSIFAISFIIFGGVVSFLLKKQKESELRLKESLRFQQELIDTIPVPVFYKDEKLVYMGCNQSFARFIGAPLESIIGKTVYDLAPKELADTYQHMDMELINHPGVQVYEYEVNRTSGEKRSVIFNKATFLKANGELGGMIGAMLDITERRLAEQEKDGLILRLQEALEKVKVLSGFIPICASCKKIRDDKGFWNHLEEYISTHSDAVFSHGMCPDCAHALYPQWADKIIGPSSA